jgi:hypothetical protein
MHLPRDDLLIHVLGQSDIIALSLTCDTSQGFLYHVW